MRLIDADLLKKDISKWLKSSNNPHEAEMVILDDIAISVIEEIDERPTAYDVDKVVKELNKLDVVAIKRYKGGNFGDYEGTDYYIKQSKAIEIVKAGGKNE